jgi:hypothetical protein
MTQLTVAEVLRSRGLGDAEGEIASSLGEWLDEYGAPSTGALGEAELTLLSLHAGVAPADAASTTAAVISSAALGVMSRHLTWDAEAMGRELGLRASSVRRRLAQRELYALERKSGGKRLFPRWQVHDGQVLPSLGDVLAALPTDLSMREVEQFFCAQDSTVLEEVAEAPRPSVREWLVSGGDPAPVIAGARRLAERGA